MLNLGGLRYVLGTALQGFAYDALRAARIKPFLKVP